MKKLGILVLALAVIAFCFTGCTIKSQLSGTKWKATSFVMDDQDLVAKGGNVTLSFEKDGTFTIGISGGALPGTWKAEGNTITLSLNLGSTSSSTATINNNVLEVTGLKLYFVSSIISSFTAEKI